MEEETNVEMAPEEAVMTVEESNELEATNVPPAEEEEEYEAEV